MYAYVATAAVSAALAFGAGWKTQGWRHDAAELERTRIESRDKLKRIEHVDQAAVGHESFKAKTEIRYVTRTQVVDRIVGRPVYRNACFDDDGLRELNAAIAGGEATGQPAPEMPGSAARTR